MQDAGRNSDADSDQETQVVPAQQPAWAPPPVTHNAYFDDQRTVYQRVTHDAQTSPEDDADDVFSSPLESDDDEQATRIVERSSVEPDESPSSADDQTTTITPSEWIIPSSGPGATPPEAFGPPGTALSELHDEGLGATMHGSQAFASFPASEDQGELADAQETTVFPAKAPDPEPEPEAAPEPEPEVVVAEDDEQHTTVLPPPSDDERTTMLSPTALSPAEQETGGEEAPAAPPEEQTQHFQPEQQYSAGPTGYSGDEAQYEQPSYQFESQYQAEQQYPSEQQFQPEQQFQSGPAAPPEQQYLAGPQQYFPAGEPATNLGYPDQPGGYSGYPAGYAPQQTPFDPSHGVSNQGTSYQYPDPSQGYQPYQQGGEQYQQPAVEQQPYEQPAAGSQYQPESQPQQFGQQPYQQVSAPPQFGDQSPFGGQQQPEEQPRYGPAGEQFGTPEQPVGGERFTPGERPQPGEEPGAGAGPQFPQGFQTPPPPVTPVPEVLPPTDPNQEQRPAWGSSDQPFMAPQNIPGRFVPTAEEFAARRAHRPQAPEASMGLPGLVKRLTFGIFAPPMSKREEEHREYVSKVRRNFGGLRQITVVNPKGGAGKTVACLLTAMTFGQNRGGYVLAWDNNETQGTLGMRAQPDFHARTVRDVMQSLDTFLGPSGKVGDLSSYVRAQGEAMFDVLASDESATAGEMLTAAAFKQIREVVSRFYKLIIVDTGNNVRAENWQAAIDQTDQLVVTMSARGDSAETAARMLDHLEQTGRSSLVRHAVTVVSMPPSRRGLDLPAIERHFSARTRAVLIAPYEPIIDSGEPIRYEAITNASKEAWLRIASAVAEGL